VMTVVRPAEVTLIDPGSHPRRPLRYRFRPDQAESMVIESRGVGSTAIGDRQMKLPIPPLRTVYRIEAKEVMAAGDLRFGFRAESMEVIEAPGNNLLIVEGAKALFRAMEGLRGHGTITSRGIGLEAEVDEPRPKDPMVRQAVDGIRQSLRQFPIPLPEEAVGKGARWKVRMPVTANGVEVEQTAVYKLVDVFGDRLFFEALSTSSASGLEFQEPIPFGGGKTRTVKVDSLELSGTDKGTFDLARLVPFHEARSTISIRMELPGSQGAGPQKAASKTEMEQKIIAKEEAK